MSTACYAIRSMYSSSDTTTFKIIYFADFHSIMEYRIISWGNSSDSRKIFQLHKKIERIMTGSTTTDSCKPLFRTLKILTSPSQYLLSWWLFWFTICSISLLTLQFIVSIQEGNQSYTDISKTSHLIRRVHVMRV
jgi:hypothetical protein